MAEDMLYEDCPKAPGSHCTHWHEGMEICCECDKVCWIEPDLLAKVQIYLKEIEDG